MAFMGMCDSVIRVVDEDKAHARFCFEPVGHPELGHHSFYAGIPIEWMTGDSTINAPKKENT